MRLTAMLASFVAVVACAVPATAGNAANDPLRLVLQRSDFPAKATWSAVHFPTYDKQRAAEGFQGKWVNYAAEVPLGSGETLRVSGQVVKLTSAGQARRLFAQSKREVVQNLQLAKVVRLAAYGDEQLAVVHLDPRADLYVRKGAVFWSVEVILRGTGTSTSAKAQAQLKTYATKLKRRVGSG